MNKKISLILVLLVLLTTSTCRANEAANIESNTPQSDHSVKFMGGLGVGYNTYNSSVVSIGQFSLIPKFAATYRNKKHERLSISLSTFFTAIPLNSSPVSIKGISDDVTIRYLGANLRFGYETPWLPAPWHLQINLGWYYNTTFVTNNRFGYVNAMGPQLFPMVDYQINENSKVGGYLKFSPLSSNGVSLKNSEFNYELAFGTHYMPPGLILEKYKYTINFDFAHLTMKQESIRMFANSSSIGLSLLF